MAMLGLLIELKETAPVQLGVPEFVDGPTLNFWEHPAITRVIVKTPKALATVFIASPSELFASCFPVSRSL
jgi:hypothetical protein